MPSVDSLKSAWSSSNTIFVFDTNVFLNLYGYEDQTRIDFFNTTLKLKEKIWIPHHVGLEYHRNRLKVIKNEKKVFRDINAFLDKINTSINTELNKLGLSKKFPEINNHLQELAANIKLHVDATKNKISPWDIKQADVRSNDNILESLDELTHDRIGSPPENQEWLDNLYEEGKIRYAEKTPPGFEDRTKGDSEKEAPTFTHGQLKYERAFGDLIIWKQLLSKAASAEVKRVIFITDDAKKDWWSIIDSAGEKIIGPHESLKSEICRVSNVELFHMYSTSDFLRDGKLFLNSEILDSSISDAYEKSEHTIEEEDDNDQDSPSSDYTDELTDKILHMIRKTARSYEVNSNQKSSVNSAFPTAKINTHNNSYSSYHKRFLQHKLSRYVPESESTSEEAAKQKDAQQFDDLRAPTSNRFASQSDLNQHNSNKPMNTMSPPSLDFTDDELDSDEPKTPLS